MRNFSITQRVFLFMFILLLSSCGGNGSNPDVQINELSNSATSYDETIHINNCGGKADSEQTKSRSFSTNIEGGIDIGVRQIVEGVISAKYSQYRNASVSQRLVAPAGTNMEFVLRWSEEVHAGNVTVNGSTGTYQANIPIAVEQTSSQDLGCSGNSQIVIPIASTFPAQAATEAPVANLQETLTISFQDGASGTSTKYKYYGIVLVAAEGKGQAAGPKWSDPFYIFTNEGGQNITPWHPPEFYNWALWINGEPADSFVESIPPYNPNHYYEFIINAPGGYLTFAVGDAATSDNNGYFAITILTQ